jgi:3-hydroxybutyryl-CoA dehydratase
VTVRDLVKHVRADKPILTLETVCSNQRNERVMEGEAVLLMSPEEIS